jgi:hypothetical protein
MALTDIETAEQNDWDALREVNLNELQQARDQLKEVALLLEQSQDEVNRLAQRNAEITVQLGQVQGKFETVPREEIRKAYEAALDTQGRLFNMRGRLESLQNDQQHLQQRAVLLERIASCWMPDRNSKNVLRTPPPEQILWKCWYRLRSPSANASPARCTMVPLNPFPTSSYRPRSPCDSWSVMKPKRVKSWLA